MSTTPTRCASYVGSAQALQRAAEQRSINPEEDSAGRVRSQKPLTLLRLAFRRCRFFSAVFSSSASAVANPHRSFTWLFFRQAEASGQNRADEEEKEVARILAAGAQTPEHDTGHRPVWLLRILLPVEPRSTALDVCM